MNEIPLLRSYATSLVRFYCYWCCYRREGVCTWALRMLLLLFADAACISAFGNAA